MNPQQSDNYIEFHTQYISQTVYSHIIKRMSVSFNDRAQTDSPTSHIPPRHQ